MSNNDWAVQRRDGAEESRENNVIYIGRASFRMEPAPFTADEIVGPMAPSPVARDSGFDASQSAGEDVEPPYLRLRTLIDESQVKDLESQHVPELDLTEFAVFAENTGVEIIGRNAPAMPRTLIADVASFPHAMPTGVEPPTELVEHANRRLSFSRTRLIGWGALAFCAGLVASATAHMIAAPAGIGATANAASAPAIEHAAPTAPAPAAPLAAPAPVPVPARAAEAPVVAEPVNTVPARNETEARGAAEGAGAESSLAIAMPSPVRTRNGATAQSHAQTRARGKMRSLPRGGATAADSVTTDSKPASDDTASDDQAAAPPAAHAKAHQAAGWVDPFAE